MLSFSKTNSFFASTLFILLILLTACGTQASSDVNLSASALQKGVGLVKWGADPEKLDKLQAIQKDVVLNFGGVNPFDAFEQQSDIKVYQHPDAPIQLGKQVIEEVKYYARDGKGIVAARIILADKPHKADPFLLKGLDKETIANLVLRGYPFYELINKSATLLNENFNSPTGYPWFLWGVGGTKEKPNVTIMAGNWRGSESLDNKYVLHIYKVE